jgi:hypothetical protein
MLPASPVMLTVAFYEGRLHDLSEDHWISVKIPVQVPVEGKNGRLIIEAFVPEEVTHFRVPAKGYVRIEEAGRLLHSFEYSNIPFVSSDAKAIEADEQNTAGPIDSDRAKQHPAKMSDEFKGYVDLPKTKRFHLNAVTDPYSVLVKLEKQEPSKLYGCEPRNEYFVYGITRIAVYLPQPACPPQRAPVAAPAKETTPGLGVTTEDTAQTAQQSFATASKSTHSAT